MFLNLQIHKNYDKDIVPFIRNGIIIDTSVLIIIVDGIVDTRVSKKKSSSLKEILYFLNLIKINNRWDKFFVTPHILTELCTHIRKKYCKWEDFRKVVEEIIPVIRNMGEKIVQKDKILQLINFKNPVVEIGDMSIFVVADDFINKHIKVAILADDRELNERYQDSKDVLLMDYKANILNLL